MLRSPGIGKLPVVLRITECPGVFHGYGQFQNGLDPSIVYSCLFSFTLFGHRLDRTRYGGLPCNLDFPVAQVCHLMDVCLEGESTVRLTCRMLGIVNEDISCV